MLLVKNVKPKKEVGAIPMEAVEDVAVKNTHSSKTDEVLALAFVKQEHHDPR